MPWNATNDLFRFQNGTLQLAVGLGVVVKQAQRALVWEVTLTNRFWHSPEGILKLVNVKLTITNYLTQ